MQIKKTATLKKKAKTVTSRPYAGTRLAKFIETRVLELRPRKSQIEIATEAGYVNPNVLAMIKNGSTKLPLDRVPSVAKALECDPKLLFKLALEQSGGAMTAVAVEAIFGTVVTRNEVVWLEEIREASDHSDPNLTARSRRVLRAVFGK
ncbi:XRE family transcriptional regulator [Cypionkella sp. TWP1-2-1b2]|uniref:XRE family transcriptional regulator n=1 Tax=Cypionkella sp. TWP1-2-1b2 TaxID=2804675 RepID=UPI003CE98E22